MTLKEPIRGSTGFLEGGVAEAWADIRAGLTERYTPTLAVQLAWVGMQKWGPKEGAKRSLPFFRLFEFLVVCITW